MKRKIFQIIVLSAIILFSGCEDFLTDKPESVLTQVNFFTTPTRINQGITGCYAGMATVMNEEWRFTEMRSDNGSVLSTGSSSIVRTDLCDIAFFRTSPSLPMLLDFWYKIFQNISNINAVLPSVLDNSYVKIETERAQYEAELRFMRAFHYYTLVNLWGDMFKITSVIGPNDALKLNRRPVDEIYNEIIIPDLIIAANQAPASYSTANLGHITKWAAKSMLAKSYMMRGGDENLAKAKLLLEEVIAAPQHGLLTDKGSSPSAYANIFSIANEMNKEIIFAVRYAGQGTGIGSMFWTYFAPDGSANLFLKIGTPDYSMAPTFEIRNLFSSNTTDTRSDACFRIWNRSATTQMSYISKYMDPTMTQVKQSENDWPVIRYADVLLLHAEITAQGPNPDDARANVNLVRARAGLSPYVNFATKQEALDSVYHERRLELAFENHRWYDLLRMAKSYNDPDMPMRILKTHTFMTDWDILYSQFKPIVPPEQFFYTNPRLLLPIPQSEIDTNKEIEIEQNPTY